MQNKGKYYITTAIAYTSGKPHIGNSYEIVLADAIARYKRADGYDVHATKGQTAMMSTSRPVLTNTVRRSRTAPTGPA